ncbi:MAG: O-antigen polymerase family [uncultured bacterium]|uniref:O-antigen polymerase n=4 Tax=Candidatus Daviesiibacteriota TaxID=1752718 RepID=A0A0G0F3R5_9BACT|nr:MAG: O-antigen polymerase family [uncultured bacterium]KKQ08170.1 MAG: O-antigen polymerase [Candidatus Daviesbacteria bacterium GW2011_GWB1_36_5]KKQ15632.1 MAG: O-antigen polymerase [Candidatus Daviesbacteria bacterium GW2011_GWA1_36_8]OGE17506.1 MAG: hypothetical protein A2858_01205 [Candidatus Daviesbacteria bacterium RIFCSPHIGHO2_01_FULL_36_37]OGE36601.1 MAG: hypothetical protein A3E66_03050 [Candidatus Daviesbacteria bacterium RIFCSPHIGHO2_12_FULL_37_16]
MSLAATFQSLVIAFAPFYILRGYIPLPILNLNIPTTLLEVLIILSLVSTFVGYLKSKDNLKVFRTKFDRLILLFLFASFISIFFSPDFIGGIGIFRAYFLEPILFYYALVYETRKVGYGFVINSLVVSGLILSLIAIIQKFSGLLVFAPHELEQGRVSGVYNSANSLALYLGPISILSLSIFLKLKNNFKFLYLGLFLLNVLILLWTRSRGGLAAEAGAVLIMVYGILSVSSDFKIKFVKIRTEVFRRLWVFIPILFILFTTFFYTQIYQIYSTYPQYIAAHEVKGDTLHIRYLIWKSTIEMLKDSPLFGAGLDGFKSAYEQIYKPSIFPEQFQYPHNLILTFWVETGILGLIAFLLLIYKVYFLLMKNIFKTKDPYLGIALIAIMTYWMIHGLVDVPYFKNDLSLEFWVVLALISGFLENK